MVEISAQLARDRVEHLTTTYEQLARITYVKSAHFVGDQYNVLVQRSQRDLIRNKTRNTIKSFTSIATHDGNNREFISSQPFPTELGENVVLVSVSPSGQKMCYVRSDEGDKQYIEIWSNTGLLYCVPTEGKHGKIYLDDWFGGVCWSKDERKIIYTAEHNPIKCENYWEASPPEEKDNNNNDQANKKGEKKVLGAKYEFKEDWGESYAKRSLARVYLCEFELKGRRKPQITEIELAVDKEQDKQSSEPLLENLAMCQAQFTPDGNGIVFVGHETHTRRLGLKYCFQRKYQLYYMPIGQDKHEKPVVISGDDWNARYPRFSPDGKQLAYLTTGKVGYHNTCSKLVIMDWTSRTRRVAVDIVNESNNENGFPGLFTATLKDGCWCSDNTHIIMDTVWRSSNAVIRVNVQTGAVERLSTRPGSFSLLDVKNDVALVAMSTPTTPHRVLVCDVFKNEWTSVETTNETLNDSDDALLASIDWSVLKVPVPPASTEDLHSSNNNHNNKNNNATTTDVIECVLVTPKNMEKGKTPVIVNPHGGPHSTFVTEYLIDSAFLALAGLAVLKINFRGSIGFGQKFVEILPKAGIGKLDIQDCMAAYKYVLDNFDWADHNRAVAYGGSHGGFISAHLIGQFPDTFKACVMRNPVTNVASMTHESDIPDWCYTEANYDQYVHKIADAESQRRMFELSPMFHINKVVTPTMILLGEDDKRVPNTQGKQFYYALKERQVPTRLFVYPGNGHAIVTPSCEADALINAAVFMEENMNGVQERRKRL